MVFEQKRLVLYRRTLYCICINRSSQQRELFFIHNGSNKFLDLTHFVLTMIKHDKTSWKMHPSYISLYSGIRNCKPDGKTEWFMLWGVWIFICCFVWRLKVNTRYFLDEHINTSKYVSKHLIVHGK